MELQFDRECGTMIFKARGDLEALLLHCLNERIAYGPSRLEVFGHARDCSAKLTVPIKDWPKIKTAAAAPPPKVKT